MKNIQIEKLIPNVEKNAPYLCPGEYRDCFPDDGTERASRIHRSVLKTFSKIKKQKPTKESSPSSSSLVNRASVKSSNNLNFIQLLFVGICLACISQMFLGFPQEK
ncbi:MAG: hypothetical protein ACI8RA_002765 [Chlamydiales bacterium]